MKSAIVIGAVLISLVFGTFGSQWLFGWDDWKPIVFAGGLTILVLAAIYVVAVVREHLSQWRPAAWRHRNPGAASYDPRDQGEF